METIAETAARYLRERNAEEGSDCWTLDCGRLGALHDIYRMHNEALGYEGDAAVSGRLMRSAFGKRPPVSKRARYAVLDALGNTSKGRELFECKYVTSLYPGIVNGECRLFTLREEFR